MTLKIEKIELDHRLGDYIGAEVTTNEGVFGIWIKPDTYENDGVIRNRQKRRGVFCAQRTVTSAWGRKFIFALIEEMEKDDRALYRAFLAAEQQKAEDEETARQQRMMVMRGEAKWLDLLAIVKKIGTHDADSIETIEQANRLVYYIETGEVPT